MPTTCHPFEPHIRPDDTPGYGTVCYSDPGPGEDLFPEVYAAAGTFTTTHHNTTVHGAYARPAGSVYVTLYAASDAGDPPTLYGPCEVINLSGRPQLPSGGYVTPDPATMAKLIHAALTDEADDETLRHNANHYGFDCYPSDPDTTDDDDDDDQ